MQRSERLFRLLRLLRARRVTTADELAESLGVSKRTIYRDVDALRGSDVPIRGEAGVGYALDKDWELPAMRFTVAELEALLMGVRVAQTWGDQELREGATSLLTKVQSRLPAPLRRVLSDTPLHTVDLRPTRIDSLTPLRHAIAERRRVRCLYEDSHGARTQRTVRPVGLHFWGRTWTLAAWCELREAYRAVRGDRVVAPEVLDRFDAEVSLEGFMEAQISHG